MKKNFLKFAYTFLIIILMGQETWASNSIDTWSSLQVAFNAACADADNPTIITLAADITAEVGDTYLELKGGRHVILDLNGHTLDRHMTAAQEGKGYVIQVFGSTTSLTIRDNSTAQTGTITGGWSRYGAGCILVTNNATLRLESGTISGNRVTQNGGAIALYGNLYMTGGTITGNAANIDNLSSVYCGALYFSDSSHFYMSGGSITGNYCGITDSGAAGIGCYAGMGHSHVHLSGSYDISGNQQGTYSNGTWSNLTPSDILNHERITYDIDGAISPSQPARMIVDAHYSKATFTSGWATYMSGKDPELVFTLANPNGQGIGLNSDGEATIGDLHTITLADGLTASTTQAAPGRPITLSGGTPSLSRYIVTYNDGKVHTDYYMADANGQATFQMPNADASISSEAAVTYIDEKGDLQTCTNFTLIESHEGDIEIGNNDNKEKWYAVSGPVTIHGRLQIYDQNIHLILCDGASFTVTNATSSAIRCSRNVTIYGQSAQSGTITATATSSEYSCIDVPSHTLTINGGTINATCDNASAIYTRTLTINRGTISVTGYYGINCSNSVTINGGTVNAHGSDSYYAIYGNSNVTINGGIIDAESPTKAIYAQNGILTLGWTNATDRITASSYYTKYGSICVKDGQILTDNTNYYSGTLTSEQLTTMAGQTLQPYVPTGMTLANVGGDLTATFDGTSTTTLNIPAPITVKQVTYNRTFSADKASTVMLPFDYTCNGKEGGTFYSFEGVEKNGSAWIATMKATADALTANTPYLFMPKETTITFDNIPSEGVTLNTTGGGNSQTADKGSNWTFKGTYSYIKWTTDTSDPDYNADHAAEIGSVYGFAGVDKNDIKAGDFVKVKSGAKIRPMSCYLLWSDTPNGTQNRAAAAEDDELPQSITVKLLDANDEVTSIGMLDTTTGEVTFDGRFDMNGRKLDGKPTIKGLYINNGRKIIIK